MALSDYRAPSVQRAADYRVGWLKEVIDTGEAYLKAQRGYADIDRSLDIMASIETDAEKIPKSLSHVRINRIKRQIREVVATLSNLRLSGAYRTDNRNFEKNEGVLNRVLNAWWYNTFVDRSLHDALQWAAVGGVGYVRPVYERDFWVAGRGDIRLHVYGPRDVLPFQIGRDHDLQRAYAVTIRTEVPLAQAHVMYPVYADLIKADRTAPGWLGRAIKRGRNAVASVFTISPRATGEETNIPVPVCDVYDTYVLDQTINTGPDTIPMGEPNTSWYYEVPVLSSDIPTGYFDSSGRELLRKASPEDARLYPLRRRMTMISDQLVYDGTSEWWHGKVPVVRFTLDDCVWDFLGSSLARDNDSIQRSIIEVLRSIEDKIKVGLRPPTQYDEQSGISKSLIERLDLRQPGQSIPVNTSMGEGLKPLLPADFYRVPPEAFQYVKEMEERMDHQMGVRDMVAAFRARQLPSGDTLEKMLEIAGPLVADMARNEERSIRDLLEMVKPLFFQFYTVPRRLQILGPDGLVEEDYDFDPGDMVPSHLPGEDIERPSRYTKLERARWHQNNFIYHVVPTSGLQLTHAMRKLVYMQLQKLGFPIDPWTMSEVMEISNFGSPPSGANTVLERWVAWQRLQAELQATLMKEFGVAPQPPGARGRKPSGGASPQVQSKGGGTRSTVAESR